MLNLVNLSSNGIPWGVKESEYDWSIGWVSIGCILNAYFSKVPETVELPGIHCERSKEKEKSFWKSDEVGALPAGSAEGHDRKKTDKTHLPSSP